MKEVDYPKEWEVPYASSGLGMKKMFGQLGLYLHYQVKKLGIRKISAVDEIKEILSSYIKTYTMIFIVCSVNNL